MLKIFSTFDVNENTMNRLYFIFLPVLIFWFASCEREDISSNPSLKLNFSRDTVMFDTVFTTIGSSTRYFKVYNKNSNDLRISSIERELGLSFEAQGRPGWITSQEDLCWL